MNYECDEIMQMLPHRAPFLLIDRVIECEPGKRAVAIKNVTIDEPFFQGHFPCAPIMPGALLIESAAQAAAVMYGLAYMDSEDAKGRSAEEAGKRVSEHVGYLAEVKSMKFMKLVRPGDSLRIEVVKKGQFANLSMIGVEIRTQDGVAARGKLSVSENAQKGEK